MRKVVLLAALFSPLALADAISVAAHSVLRLPNKASVVHLQRLEVADSATLVLPASLVELKVDELHLGNQARLGWVLQIRYTDIGFFQQIDHISLETVILICIRDGSNNERIKFSIILFLIIGCRTVG